MRRSHTSSTEGARNRRGDVPTVKILAKWREPFGVKPRSSAEVKDQAADLRLACRVECSQFVIWFCCFAQASLVRRSKNA